MYAKLFFMFIKIGFLSFGGGYPMMALIYEEGQRLLDLTSGEFADMLALELLSSGPVAINGATYIGYIKGGIIGSIIATIGVCVPSFILVSIVYFFLSKFYENPYIQGFLTAIKISCAGILLATALNLARGIFFLESGSVAWVGILIWFAGLISLVKYKVNAIQFIFAAAILGVILL
ncbi:chromate transporter [Tissierella sp. Yu-01]|uniref:chromate transporter n=1 Tax=Tissierella sp. Yu-01 TaxID=3035694 RepID=UPI00240E1DF8|nr:chromate transporter [Tissierella sp. Yu-01]WFA07797.1 chromate transporter [Tissierella sp. Yu-01]